MKHLLLFLTLIFLIQQVFAGTQATALSESFEGSFPPSGWTAFSDGLQVESWAQSSAKSRTGTYSAVGEPRYFYGHRIWLVTPAIDLSSAPSAKLYFYEDSDNWSSGGETITVSVSTTSASNSSSFTTVLEMTPATHVIPGFSGSVQEIDLSDYVSESTVYVGFSFLDAGSPSYSWYIDDIKVVIPSDHDVMVKDITMDAHYAPNTTVQPTAVVQNEGLNTESFDVQFGYIDWNDTEQVINTQTVTSLAVGAQTTVTFANYTFAEQGYTYFVRTDLTGDMDSSNDLATKNINSYANQKDVVLAEKFTDVNCTYCPGAANGLDSLYHDFPDYIAIIAYHGGYSTSDPYDNQYAEDRRGYYPISGYPTTFFGGDQSVVGGAAHDGDWVSYPYEPMEEAYLAEREEYTPFTMDIFWSKDGDDITAIATVTYDGITLAKEDYLRWALNESDISYSWQTSMTELHFVEQAMYDDATGTKMWSGSAAPSVGTEFQDEITFALPVGVVEDNCELIAFVQDDETKEVRIAAKVRLADGPSAIENDSEDLIVNEFKLMQNYPNPFNPTTTIEYSMPQQAQAEISLYNLSGEKIKTLVSGVQAAGQHQLQLDGSNLASGVYFYTLKSGMFTATKKLILLK